MPSAPSGGGYGGGGNPMAQAQMMMGLFSSIIGTMNQAQQQNRINQALTLNNQGIAAYNNGQWQDAINAFQQAVALKPDDPNMRNNLRMAQDKYTEQANAIMAAHRQRLNESKQRIGAMLGALDGQVANQNAAAESGLDSSSGPAPSGTSFFGVGGGPSAATPQTPQPNGLDFQTNSDSRFSKGYNGSAPPDLRSGAYSATPENAPPGNATVGNATVGKPKPLDFTVSNQPPPSPSRIKLVSVAPAAEVTIPKATAAQTGEKSNASIGGYSARERDIVIDAIQLKSHNAASADLYLRQLLTQNPSDQDLRAAESYLSGWSFAMQLRGGHPPPLDDDHKKTDLLSPKPGVDSLKGEGPPKTAAELAAAQQLPNVDASACLFGNDCGARPPPVDPHVQFELDKWKAQRDRLFVHSLAAHGDIFKSNFTDVRRDLEKKVKADPKNADLRDALRLAQGAEAQQLAEK